MPSAPSQHLYADMLARVREAARSLAPNADLSRIVVEPPKDPTHGDMATNAAMVLAKDPGRKPRELPEEWRLGLDPADPGAGARHIADFIAGMTDRYALIEHARLFDSTPELR